MTTCQLPCGSHPGESASRPHNFFATRSGKPVGGRGWGGCVALLAVLVALGLSGPLVANEPAEGAAAPPTNSSPAVTADPADALRTYLLLQEQLHSAQMAIERIRQESADAADRNAATIAARLQALEQSLTAQRATERSQLESTYRLMLYVGGGCVTLGFVAMLLTAYFQWRAVSRLTELSLLSRASLAAGRAALPGPGAETTAALAEQTSNRLQDALGRLEKQIHSLEQGPPVTPADNTLTAGETVSASSSALPPPKHERLAALVGKGESLLDLDQPEAALAVFNDILTLAPDHAETLAKKGDALERLQRFDEAIECYDAAIARDASFTIAYLHKGALLNRMERYSDALKCYEEALRTQEKGGDVPARVPS